MPIVFHEKSKTFHLFNAELSYIIEIMENGQPGNLYYGKKIHDRENFAHLHEELGRSHASFIGPEPSALALQHARQEYPSFGTGDYRYPAFEIRQGNGSRIMEFHYVSHEIYPGKRDIDPLPATYAEDDSEASSLEIILRDALTETRLTLCYTIYEGLAAITRSAKFTQEGGDPVVLTQAMSASVDLPDSGFDMLTLSGAWGRERFPEIRPLARGIQSVYSMRGASSAEHNPFLALKRPDAGEQSGEVYGFSLVYSGNFLGQAECCTFGTTRVIMGIHPHFFEWPLRPGESFQTPEVVLVYSCRGLNGMSQTYHKLYRTRLSRGPWRDKPRPVLLNNWEATEMEFDEGQILEIARKGQEAGVELFVLDDGWFGARDNDRAGLGDWYVNTSKLPGGITGLSRKVEEMGMKFGLWIEPEMVNKDSDLYRAHPDWIIAAPGRFQPPSRSQHVLDFSNGEVVDYIHGMIAKVIRESSISYIKWDMNRYITGCYSPALDAGQQGTVMHKYILGVYELYRRLIGEFPNILFESCASGGARFDPGMLYFAPQAWASDDSDANERMKIQYGTSYAYPVISMGAHVSAVPNMQARRMTPLETRANVAFFGAFGYELDLNHISGDEFEQVKRQISFMKAHRDLIQRGVFYRLKNPFQGNETAWIVVSEDRSGAIALYGQSLNTVNEGWLRLHLDGLDPDVEYCVAYAGRESNHYGDELMNAGLTIDRRVLDEKGGDFASLLFELNKV